LIDACLHYSWPGNLRELQNFVKRYLVMADEVAAIRELHSNPRRKFFPAEPVAERALPSLTPVAESNLTGDDRGRDLKFMVRNLKDETEIQAITKALAETNWNRKRAAGLLHISYRGLLYKIRQHGITRVAANRVTPFFHNGESAT
jgi:two-component system response regulator AtoC